MSPITVNQMPCVEINCDGCGTGDNSEYETNYHHHSEQEAIDCVRGMDWLVTDDLVALCTTCQETAEEKVACPTCERGVGSRCDVQHPEQIGPMGSHEARIVEALVNHVLKERETP